MEAKRPDDITHRLQGVSQERVEAWFNSLPEVPPDEQPKVDRIIFDALDRVIGRRGGRRPRGTSNNRAAFSRRILDRVHLTRFLLLRWGWHVLRPLLEGYLSRKAGCHISVDSIVLSPGSDIPTANDLHSRGVLKLIMYSPAERAAWRRPAMLFTTRSIEEFVGISDTGNDRRDKVVTNLVFCDDRFLGLGGYQIPIVVVATVASREAWLGLRSAGQTIADRMPAPDEAYDELLRTYLHDSLRLCQQWAAFLVSHHALTTDAELIASSPSREMLNDALWIVHDALLADSTPSEDCVVWYYAPDLAQQTLLVVAGTEPYPDLGQASVSIGRGTAPATWGLSGRAYKHRQQYVSRDAQFDPRVLHAKLERVDQVVATPLILSGRDTSVLEEAFSPVALTSDFKDMGVLYVGLRNGKAFAPHHILFLRHFAQIMTEWLIRSDTSALIAAAIGADHIWHNEYPANETYRGLLDWVDTDYSWNRGDALEWLDRRIRQPRSQVPPESMHFLTQRPDAVRRDGDGLHKVSILNIRVDQQRRLSEHFASDRVLASIMETTKGAIEGLLTSLITDPNRAIEFRCAYYQHRIVVILINCDQEGAENLAQALQFRFGMEPISIPSNDPTCRRKITISLVGCTLTVRDLWNLGFGSGGESVVDRAKKAFEGLLQELHDGLRRLQNQRRPDALVPSEDESVEPVIGWMDVRDPMHRVKPLHSPGAQTQREAAIDVLDQLSGLLNQAKALGRQDDDGGLSAR